LLTPIRNRLPDLEKGEINEFLLARGAWLPASDSAGRTDELPKQSAPQLVPQRTLVLIGHPTLVKSA
jgi:hypothetical protein